MKKRYLVAFFILAMVLGGVVSYVGMEMVQSDNGQALDQDNVLDDSSQASVGAILDGVNQGKADELMKVTKAYNLIQEKYVTEVESNQLVEGAIQGMLATLDDPYSTYMDQETMEQFNNTISSSFEGIGTEVSMRDGNVTIVSPFKGSPAEEAGLKPNDQILSVDGESIDGLDLYEAVLKIRGEKGTTVTLEIKRPGVEEALTVDVKRDTIPIETVYSDVQMVDGQKAGIIEITSFSENTAADFEQQLEKLEKQNIEGLVIDVRGNPGGLFPAAQDILSLLITKDTPYVQIEDSNGEKERYFSNLSKPKSYPITVLIDEGSASASEILAGAMHEAGGYELIGTKTFGKGTVQQAIPMGDGSNLKLTIFKWLTPEGNWIHEKGIEPTKEVKLPDYYYTNPIQIDKPLTYDQTDDKIANLQTMLEGLGYDPGRTDGYYSKQTEAAVKQLQQDNDLPVTGEVDKETGKNIQEAIIDKVRNKEDDTQMKKALEVLFESE
ncbi:S41 family peptidase [Pontibacillus litoralis]|uniref:C-terminal processing peptidase n=1 Tax=Pontibacillus litoralis JSM 072002 TaxID=1385512 RepID=A0A0A5G2C0_9BACI|nr:peptidase S41 [Pontibacillus litoralis JSM 072002]